MHAMPTRTFAGSRRAVVAPKPRAMLPCMNASASASACGASGRRDSWLNTPPVPAPSTKSPTADKSDADAGSAGAAAAAPAAANDDDDAADDDDDDDEDDDDDDDEPSAAAAPAPEPRTPEPRGAISSLWPLDCESDTGLG